jgi:hypothetical protein
VYAQPKKKRKEKEKRKEEEFQISLLKMLSHPVLSILLPTL